MVGLEANERRARSEEKSPEGSAIRNRLAVGEFEFDPRFVILSMSPIPGLE